jgi:hypothetical protein
MIVNQYSLGGGGCHAVGTAGACQTDLEENTLFLLVI